MTSTITFEALHLPGMLADLAATAGRDKVPPDFQAVQLYVSGGHLYGWSSDRYRCGQARCEILGTEVPPFRLARGSCLEIAKALKGGTRVEVTLTLDSLGMVSSVGVAGAVRLEVPAIIGLGMPGVKLSRIMPTELAKEPDTEQVFRPEFIADLVTIAKRRGTPLVLALGAPKKAAHVSIGPDYRAWVMPVLGWTPEWLVPVWE